MNKDKHSLAWKNTNEPPINKRNKAQQYENIHVGRHLRKKGREGENQGQYPHNFILNLGESLLP